MNSIAKLLRLSLLIAFLLAPELASAQASWPSAGPCQPAIVPGKIAGTIRTSDGQPLQGVAVTAHATTGATTAVGYTNIAGEYGISVPAAAYIMEFKPTSGPYRTGWYKNT